MTVESVATAWLLRKVLCSLGAEPLPVFDWATRRLWAGKTPWEVEGACAVGLSLTLAARQVCR